HPKNLPVPTPKAHGSRNHPKHYLPLLRPGNLHLRHQRLRFTLPPPTHSIHTSPTVQVNLGRVPNLALARVPCPRNDRMSANTRSSHGNRNHSHDRLAPGMA